MDAGRETVVKRGPHGLYVETERPLRADSMLVFTTMKRFHGLVSTTVRQERVEGDFRTFTFGDYNKTLAAERIRATAGNLTRQHVNAIAEYDKGKLDTPRPPKNSRRYRHDFHRAGN